jgi:uncharacterized repeat protein (TIGR03803 family)
MGVLGAFTIVPGAAGQPRFRALYQFDNIAGGRVPDGLAEANGVFYGTTEAAGVYDNGTVFALLPPSGPGGQWTETVLHTFNVQAGDAGYAETAPVIGPGGVLYGTTAYGGVFCTQGTPLGCGALYELRPPASPGGTWTEKVLYSFSGGADGGGPQSAPLLCTNPSICSEGALYGTTTGGGTYGKGTVFELQPPASPGGTWIETVLYTFAGGSDGSGPRGLAMSDNGVLYGVTEMGGPAGAGTVFQLAPPANSGGAWTETTLYTFQGGLDGTGPYEPPVITDEGTLYGTTGGACMYFCVLPYGVGMVFALKPPGTAGGNWTRTVLLRFSASGSWGPTSPLILRDGAIYGAATTQTGGQIFKLQRRSGGKWTMTVLYNFGVGINPFGSFIMDKIGTIFGTTIPVSQTPTGTAYSLRP